MNNQCDTIFDQVVEHTKKDLIEIETKSVEERLKIYNYLKQLRSYYETNCISNLSFTEKARRLGYFDLALIKYSYTLKDQGLAKEFTDDEYTAFAKLDEFLNIDYVTPEEIATELFNRSGSIYDIIRRWYDEEMYEYDKLIDPKGKKIRQTLATALRNVYILRFEKIKKGIIEYFNKDPGAPRVLFHNYEDVIRKEYEAEMERLKIEENNKKIVEEKVGSLEKQLESLLEEKQRVEQYLAQLGISGGKDLIDKIAVAIGSFQQTIRELENDKRRLEEEKKKLEDLVKASQSQVKAIVDAEISKYEQTKAKLESQISELQRLVDRLQLEKQELQSRMNEIVNVSKSPIAIKYDEARIMEVNFIGRFEIKMNSLPRKFFDPIRREEFEVKNSKSYTVYKYEEKEVPENFPRNTELTYVVRKNRILRDDLEVIVKAKFLTHIDDLKRTYYDSKRVSLSDILSYLDQAIEEARKGKVFYVIGIASPTGFSDDVKKYVSSDEFFRNFTSYYVSVILVDLLTGEIIYNKMDDRLKSFIDLYEPELEKEKMAKYKEMIKNELLTYGYITLKKATQITGGTELMIKRIFAEIEQEGYGKIVEQKDEIVLQLKT